MNLASIRNLLISFSDYVSSIFYGGQRRNSKKDIPISEFSRWFKDKGDKTLRLDYPLLDSNSIVFDVGGYVGDFANKIHQKYGCKVYVFEPHPKFFKKCVKRFKNNEKIIPLNFGLAHESGEFQISDSADSSSFFNPPKTGKGAISCGVREFFEVVEELEISFINLMKVNIEGGEYPLLEHIIDAKSVNLVNEYQIQFHDFIDNAVKRRDGIVEALVTTHERTWCYEFVWENWKSKSNTLTAATRL